MSNKAVYFHTLKIGDEFKQVHPNTGTSAYNYGPEAVMIYRKVNGTTAECIGQIGYGNTRAVGGKYFFGPMKAVTVKGSNTSLGE